MSVDRFKVLVVDDEPAIAQLIKRYFLPRGFEVFSAGSGEKMREVLNKTPIQLVILDVNLPDQDGFTLLGELRSHYSLGIIMLTAKSRLDDRLAGLNSGADDYVSKPFELSELFARSKAVLRRFHPENHQRNHRFAFSNWIIDTRTHQITDQQDQLIDLSPAEYQLLLVFIRYPQIVLSRDYLLQQTRGRSCSPFDRTIDVRIGNLRKKLKRDHSDDHSDTPLFKTVRGIGYFLDAEVTTL